MALHCADFMTFETVIKNMLLLLLQETGIHYVYQLIK